MFNILNYNKLKSSIWRTKSTTYSRKAPKIIYVFIITRPFLKFNNMNIQKRFLEICTKREGLDGQNADPKKKPGRRQEEDGKHKEAKKGGTFTGK